jgi:hypothetical protein
VVALRGRVLVEMIREALQVSKRAAPMRLMEPRLITSTDAQAFLFRG